MKVYFDNFSVENDSIELSDPVYKYWFFFSHCFVFCFGFSSLSLTPVKRRITVLCDLSRFFQFLIITDICIYLYNSLLILPSLNLFSNSLLKMDITLEKLKRYFPILPPNTITKIYRARCARLRLLMNHGIPENIRWLIEAKVWLSSESSNSFISHMPGTSTSTFAKKHRAKRLKVCHRCARCTCNATCHFLGMVSINREDKIQFIKDGLSEGSLDNLLLEMCIVQFMIYGHNSIKNMLDLVLGI